jgi:hypothetical protein
MIKKTLIALIVPAAMLLFGIPSASAHPAASGVQPQAQTSTSMKLEKNDAAKPHATAKAGKQHRHHRHGHHRHHHHLHHH